MSALVLLERLPPRRLQGLVTGIGFMGGGAILKSPHEVKGASTAAAIWATGGVGAAVATGRVELALAIALLTFLTFLVLTPVRDRLRETDNGGAADRPGSMPARPLLRPRSAAERIPLPSSTGAPCFFRPSTTGLSGA